MANQGPLAGVRVVECAGWNGVYAGKLLAEAGADVIRVIGLAGDPLATEPPFLASGRSVQETWYNAGKRVLALDLSADSGRAELLGLLQSADILLDDWLAGSEPLDIGAARAVNPGLVRVTVSPVGGDTALVANDLVANALSGAASVTGDAHTPPLTGYGNQTYHTAGLYAAICALAALRAARVSGRGADVDLSAQEALVSCTEQLLMQWFFQGNWPSSIAPRQGSLHWSGAYAVYPDRHGTGVQVTAALRFVEEILPWMIRDGAAGDLTDPTKFPDFPSMIMNLPYVMKQMRDWIAKQEAWPFFLESQVRRLPFGIALPVKEVLASPQIAARHWLSEQDVPGSGRLTLPGRLFRTDADDTPNPSPAAAGEENPYPGVRVTWAPRPQAHVDPATPGDPGTANPGAASPLAGVRILDFTHVLAGPFGTRVLGDLGADVIKVGTGVRSAGANNPSHPYYVSWNRNKRSIQLDMSTERGRSLARSLAQHSGAVIENFSAGVIARWGLDRKALRATNPGVSVVSMGGMGQTGPWRNFVTFAPTIHALVGLTYLTNPPGEHLLGYGFSLTDHLSGLAGALAILEGLEHARQTGEGIEVDLSQYELGLHLMAPTLVDALANGTRHEPVGNRHPFGAWAPHGVYRAAGDDRWVAIAVRGDAQWAALCRVMGREELAADPRFATHAARVANQDALDALVSDWTRTRDRYEVMAACQGAGLAAGAVQDAADLTGRDPNLARRAFFGVTEGDGGGYGFDRFPALFDGQRPPHVEAVHQIGADTFDVLQGVLGLDDEAIAGLMADGVLS